MVSVVFSESSEEDFKSLFSGHENIEHRSLEVNDTELESSLEFSKEKREAKDKNKNMKDSHKQNKYPIETSLGVFLAGYYRGYQNRQFGQNDGYQRQYGYQNGEFGQNRYNPGQYEYQDRKFGQHYDRHPEQHEYQNRELGQNYWRQPAEH